MFSPYNRYLYGRLLKKANPRRVHLIFFAMTNIFFLYIINPPVLNFDPVRAGLCIDMSILSRLTFTNNTRRIITLTISTRKKKLFYPRVLNTTFEVNKYNS